MATVEQIQQLLDQQAKTLKNDLKKELIETMVESVVTKVVIQLKTTIDDEMKPVKARQEKTEVDVAQLRTDLETLSSRVDRREEERVVHPAPAPDQAAAPAVGERPEEEGEAIRRLFREANSCLTFSPITEEDCRELAHRLEVEEEMEQSVAERTALRRMVEEFLAEEMLMADRHITEVMEQVTDIWPKGKKDWNGVIVRFQCEETAGWVLRGKGKMRQGVEGRNKPVVENWVPGGMYRRYNAVRSIAYRIRQKDQMKTRIDFGKDDIQLLTRKDNRDRWSAPVSLENENLPSFQLSPTVVSLQREVRSPTLAPGRARYGGAADGKRPLAASPGHSPARKEPRTAQEGEDGAPEEVGNQDNIVTEISGEDNVTERRKKP
jgi:hypothetical protein